MITAVAIIGVFGAAYLVLHDEPAGQIGAGPVTELEEQEEVPPTPDVDATPGTDVATSIAPPTPTEAGPEYVFPVQPVIKTIYSPGHEGFPATDIYAPVGTDFVAVTSGVIDEVQRRDLYNPAGGNTDPNWRNGIYIAYIGDDGVRYFGSHLSMIAPGLRAGTRVEAGQLLGRIGTTGKPRPGKPYVHFGISHPTFPGDWEVRRGEVDPYPYLRAWEKGRDRVPRLP